MRRVLLTLSSLALALASLPAPALARQAAPPTIEWMSRLAPGALPATIERPFGTLREQAAMQQAWLKQRLDTFLPALMRKYGIDLWVVPMREYNEDPVFEAIVAPETFAARRRTIYVCFDRCAAAGTAPGPTCVERIALGGTSQGGVFEARTSAKAVNNAVGGRQAEPVDAGGASRAQEDLIGGEGRRFAVAPEVDDLLCVHLANMADDGPQAQVDVVALNGAAEQAGRIGVRVRQDAGGPVDQRDFAA